MSSPETTPGASLQKAQTSPATTPNPDWFPRGDALRKARVARGEAQAAAARRMGIAQRLLNDVEHGRADPMFLLFREHAT